MSRTAIRVEGLGKRYRLGTFQPSRFSEVLQRAARNLVGSSTGWMRQDSESRRDQSGSEFWALQDITFDVSEGEVLGIVGRNGAGKSTLLKILSRIVEPTTGRYGIRGRVGSLLEVGTGFHPELTGRENIYLSGTILGMTRREIDTHFDEIVTFADIEEFLETPVKRYSSGMYVRLGFAIAAHLNPEILIVDEVLAVGDAEFQKKCLGKIGDVADSGRTVLFVSHNVAAIERLCDLALLIDNGRLQQQGPPDDVIAAYRQIGLAGREESASCTPIEDSRSGLLLEDMTVELVEDNGFHLSIELEVLAQQKPIINFGFVVSIRTATDVVVAKVGPKELGYSIPRLKDKQRLRLYAKDIGRFLNAGTYHIDLAFKIVIGDAFFFVPNAGSFEIPQHDVFGTGAFASVQKNGVVPLVFEIEKREVRPS